MRQEARAELHGLVRPIRQEVFATLFCQEKSVNASYLQSYRYINNEFMK